MENIRLSLFFNLRSSCFINLNNTYITKIEDNISNRNFEILNNAGDAGYNIIKDVNANYGDFDNLTMGQFGFDKNNTFTFNGKSKLITIKIE